MGFYAEPWLREARDKIRLVPEEISGQHAAASDFDKLADAVEKAIKAALIENHGSLPRQHDHSHLVSMCQSTGVWEILPPALQGLVEEIESYRSKKAAAASTPISSGSTDHSSAEKLQRYFFVARRLIDYMEFHVIGNDSVLKRLKVA
ncbi:MAG: HEPN domain-containing protein [Candidatus Binatia bacterium]|jgi:HEPN domain-containing protein